MADSKIGIALVLTAYDRASAKINAVANNAISRMQSVQKKAESIAATQMASGLKMIAVGGAMATPIVYATKKAIDFQEAMAGVSKVTNVNVGTAKFAELSSQASEIALQLAKSHEEAAGMMENLAQGGVEIDRLKDVALMTGKAAVAFNMDPTQTAASFMSIKNASQMSLEATKNAFDAMNLLSDKSNTEADRIISFMVNGGAATARVMKMANEEMQAFGTTLMDQGKGAEEVGTIFERLQKGIFRNSAAFQTFINAGKGTQGLLAVLNKGLQIKDEMAQQRYFRSIAGEYSTSVLQLAQSQESLHKFLGMVADKTNYANSVQNEFNNKASTTAFKIAKAKTQIQALAITVGETLRPNVDAAIDKIGLIAEKVERWVKNNKPLVQTISKVLAALSGLLLVGGGTKLLFAGIARAIGFAIGPFKTGAKVVGWLTDSKKGLGNVIFTVRYRLLQFSEFMTGKALPVLRNVARFLTGNLVKAFRFLGTTFMSIGRMMMANPIILVVMAVAVAAYLIYKNWGTIKEWFVKLWAGIKQVFSATWRWIKNMFLNYTPQGLIIQHWSKIVAFFGNLWENVKGKFSGALQWVMDIGLKFWDAGKNIVKNIWEGIKSMVNKPVEAIKSMVQKIRDHLPFSPAKIGPLRDIHRIKLVETIAASIRPQPMITAMQNSLSRFAGSNYQAPVKSSGTVILQYAPVINMNGGATQQDANNLASMGMQEFERLMKQYKNRQARISY